MTIWQILILHLEIFVAATLLLGGMIVTRNAIVKFAIPTAQQTLKHRAMPRSRTSLRSPLTEHSRRLARFGDLSENAA
ncbi:hypothetical protein [Rubinisphaera margarita]|uniref:hypothetical protein n=1 Tax=Rubinisphaera margarita TaxID=2909586 RepID=UPI001EE86EE3|nr:hypothetical protein [Rubinisphaera margarita]MCG6158590.1 hypothetical protein [Rubinisphaera margarita]